MFLEELESRLQHVIFQWLEDWRPIENEKRALAEIPSFHFHHLSKILGGRWSFFHFLDTEHFKETAHRNKCIIEITKLIKLALPNFFLEVVMLE